MLLTSAIDTHPHPVPYWHADFIVLSCHRCDRSVSHLHEQVVAPDKDYLNQFDLQAYTATLMRR